MGCGGIKQAWKGWNRKQLERRTEAREGTRAVKMTRHSNGTLQIYRGCTVVVLVQELGGMDRIQCEEKGLGYELA